MWKTLLIVLVVVNSCSKVLCQGMQVYHLVNSNMNENNHWLIFVKKLYCDITVRLHQFQMFQLKTNIFLFHIFFDCLPEIREHSKIYNIYNIQYLTFS